MATMYLGGSANFDEKTGSYMLKPTPIGRVVKRPIRGGKGVGPIMRDSMKPTPIGKVVKKPIRGRRGVGPIMRNDPGIIGRGGKNVNPFYNTY